MGLYQSRQYREDLGTTIAHSVGADALYGAAVLVTGATGTIGSFLVDTLLEMNRSCGAGIRVIAAGRSEEKLRRRFAFAGEDALVCMAYDIMRPVALSQPVDFIVHAAGNASPAAFNADPVGTIIGNVQGTHALLEAGRAQGMKRFLYVSSGEVYGQSDPDIEALEESDCGPLDATSPRSCYPASKRTAETLCASYAAQYGVEAVIVRPCHTYGPGMTRADNRAHAQFLRNALAGEDIVLKSAGSQMRSYSHVSDCVSGLLTVLARGESGQAYNLANPDARATIAQLAQEIAAAAGTRAVFETPTQADIRNRSPIARQVLCTKKLEALGWRGAFTVPKGVRHALLALREAEQ